MRINKNGKVFLSRDLSKLLIQKSVMISQKLGQDFKPGDLVWAMYRQVDWSKVQKFNFDDDAGDSNVTSITDQDVKHKVAYKDANRDGNPGLIHDDGDVNE